MKPGDRIGDYEILSAIGKGGMGEVFRARDLQLKRDVALKVLPAALASDPERMGRFQREAEVLASLNHPNIAAIYGIAQEGPIRALVMELVEGESPKGPLPWDEAWKICGQIATALEYAHDRPVVHRDLKPANVLVTADGVVKLLDFGLAKAMSTDPTQNRESNRADSLSPTLTMGATAVGTILGTAAYMAPEQAKGKPVDKRADIWAFGVVLWELLTGERLFKGEDVTDTMAQVLTKEIDFARAPAPARKLLTECLQRDPKARLRDIGDARRLIAEAAAPARASLWPWAAAAVFAIGAGVALWAPWRSTPPVSEVRFQIPRPTRTSVPFLSPDGQRIAFISDAGSISIRELNSLETLELPQARPAAAEIIWSPDSRSIVYQSRDFKLMKLAFDGSPPVALADLPAFSGGSWNDDGVILVGGRTGGIQRVPTAGGVLTPVTTLDKGQTEHRNPQFIGGGRFLYHVIGAAGAAGIYAASLSDPNGKLVLPVDNTIRESMYFFVPPSAGENGAYILYRSQSVLLAQAIDASSLELKGPAITIGQNAGAISASRTGALVYGPSSASNASTPTLHWVDRAGKEIPTLAAGVNGADATIAPSGKRWARVLNGDIWLHDMAGGAPSRFTFEAANDRFFTWSPDDQWIAYATGQGRAHDRIVRRNTVTPAAAETLVSGGADLQANDWSRDGKFLLFASTGKSTGWDLWTLDLQTKGAKPVVYLQTPVAEQSAAFSPDGHWIAYHSDESGQFEVYVQSFPAGGGKFQVSSGGGGMPRWRADGRELFFASGGSMMAVKIQTSPRFEAGVPQSLFSTTLTTTRNYDVTPDGNRFLVPEIAPVSEVEPVTVILNWQAGLKR